MYEFIEYHVVSRLSVSSKIFFLHFSFSYVWCFTKDAKPYVLLILHIQNANAIHILLIGITLHYIHVIFFAVQIAVSRLITNESAENFTFE